MLNWLPNFPNFKETLDSAFHNYIKTPLEQKANELNSTVEQKANEFEEKAEAIAHQFQTNNNSFQHAIIAILFASFCIGIITITFKDKNHDQ